MKDYLRMTYDKKDKPFTKYPQQLIDYLIDKFNLKQGKVLDFCCGRGEYMKAFSNRGFQAEGFDKSNWAGELFPELVTHQIEYDELMQLPFKDDSYDIIFNKSVLEHFFNPHLLVAEMYRLLKKDGVIITMVPKIGSLKAFFSEYDHKRALFKGSLKFILKWCGFTDVKVETITIVPIIWKYSWIKPFLQILYYLCPWLRKKSTSIKYCTSKMLLAYGRKE